MKITCKRCGYCCLVAWCDYAEYGDDGLCKFLTFNNKTFATCERIKRGDLEIEEFMTGCCIFKEREMVLEKLSNIIDKQKCNQTGLFQ